MDERAIYLRVIVVCAVIAVVCFGNLKTSAEKKNWQAGTILEVKQHPVDAASDTAAKTYDISVKVGNKVYVALYSLPEDRAEPEYYVGMASTVLVEGKTLKFNDLEGNTHTLKIVSSRDATSQELK